MEIRAPRGLLEPFWHLDELIGVSKVLAWAILTDGAVAIGLVPQIIRTPRALSKDLGDHDEQDDVDWRSRRDRMGSTEQLTLPRALLTSPPVLIGLPYYERLEIRCGKDVISLSFQQQLHGRYQ